MTAPPIPYGPGFLGLPADATEQDILDYAKTYAEEHHDAQAGNLVALLVQRLSQPIADDNHKALVEALREAEATFEDIRIRLISNLDEPERTAFWRAADGRTKVAQALAAFQSRQEEK